MSNFIRFEYITRCDSFNSLIITEEDLALAKSDRRYVQYVNPSQIVNIRTRWHKDSDSKEFEFNFVTLSTGEIIITTYTIDEILELIDGKPKK